MNRQIIIVISLLFILILGMKLVFPTYQHLKSLEKKIEAKRAEIRGRGEYLSKLDRISQELKNYQLPLSKIDSALPPDPGLPALFDFFQRTSSQSGLVLKEMSPSGITPSLDIEEIQETRLTLVVSGSYSSFKNFLHTLEKNARLIEIENISFSSEKRPPFNFNLKIKVYSY